jgi:hypothetical protein
MVVSFWNLLSRSKGAVGVQYISMGHDEVLSVTINSKYFVTLTHAKGNYNNCNVTDCCVQYETGPWIFPFISRSELGLGFIHSSLNACWWVHTHDTMSVLWHLHGCVIMWLAWHSTVRENNFRQTPLNTISSAHPSFSYFMPTYIIFRFQCQNCSLIVSLILWHVNLFLGNDCGKSHYWVMVLQTNVFLHRKLGTATEEWCFLCTPCQDVISRTVSEVESVEFIEVESLFVSDLS